MDKDDWNELVEQVREHGPEAVCFFDEDEIELWPTSISFEAGTIKVVLAE